MVEYVGSPETVHFVNWVLHSGEVAPSGLVADAIDSAKRSCKTRGKRFERIVKVRLAACLDEVMNDRACPFIGTYPALVLRTDVPENARRTNDALLGHLLALACERIDLDQAAEHVWAHVNQVAEVA